MFIGIHVHTARQPAPPRTRSGESFATPEQLIEMYDDVGIRTAIILPIVNPECAFAIQSVQEAIDIAAQYPGRFVPFCNIDPRMVDNSSDADLGCLMEYYRERGCPGVGEVCANLYFEIGSKAVDTALELLDGKAVEKKVSMPGVLLARGDRPGIEAFRQRLQELIARGD